MADVISHPFTSMSLQPTGRTSSIHGLAGTAITLSCSSKGSQAASLDCVVPGTSVAIITPLRKVVDDLDSPRGH
jgi:hypothetical protein